MVLKTNKILFSAALLLCNVYTQPLKAAEVDTNTAHMQAMDKITGRVSEIDVPVNSLVRFGSFSILVRKCVTRTPEETPENTAFVDVVDDYNSNEPINIFKGWMLSSSPALNAIEHPIYDVWLLKCINKNNANVKKLSADELKIRDEIKMVRAADNEVKSEKEEDSKPKSPSALDAMVEETIKKGVETHNQIKEEKDKTEVEVLEVVVGASDVNEDDDAPQTLIQIQTSDKENNDTVMDTVADTETTEVSEPEVLFEFEDENGFTEEDELSK